MTTKPGAVNVSTSQHLLLHPHSSKKERLAHFIAVSPANCWDRGGVLGGMQPLVLMRSLPREGASPPMKHPCWSAALCQTVPVQDYCLNLPICSWAEHSYVYEFKAKILMVSKVFNFQLLKWCRERAPKISISHPHQAAPLEARLKVHLYPPQQDGRRRAIRTRAAKSIFNCW